MKEMIEHYRKNAVVILGSVTISFGLGYGLHIESDIAIACIAAGFYWVHCK